DPPGCPELLARQHELAELAPAPGLPDYPRADHDGGLPPLLCSPLLQDQQGLSVSPGLPLLHQPAARSAVLGRDPSTPSSTFRQAGRRSLAGPRVLFLGLRWLDVRVGRGA